MATQTENPSTAAATNIAVEDNPSETLDTAVPASTKPDRVEDSTAIASSIVESPTEGPKQGADNSKSTAPATDSDKKIRRAERFGITVQLSEKEKRNSRTGVKLEPVKKVRLGDSDFACAYACVHASWVCAWEGVVLMTAHVHPCGCVFREFYSAALFVCIDVGKLKLFGTGSQGSELESDSVKKSEELKRKARAERFGIPVPPTATDVEVKKKARVERFALAPKIDALEENKRKARALRFSQSSTDSLSMNGKGDLEPVRHFMDNFSISFEWDELRQLLQARLVEGLEKRFPSIIFRFSVLTLEILLVASILIFIFQQKNSQMQHSSFSDNSLQGIRQDFDNPHFRLPIDFIHLGA
ncbi:hypothetical protein SADUNF_Sadunf06G0110100 [Salix dunnii]|uniref:THO1-MOS11 C-terminal domain-containing protein n=1 Tax=Salix dunnii TaxID=1413687 RepID=A0A835MVE4_9ROSI|nr:hypothetical protein SADUNF_Sadunf06G0110100 [Salix dunnii]